MYLVDGKVGGRAFVAPDRIVELRSGRPRVSISPLSKVLTTSATELP